MSRTVERGSFHRSEQLLHLQPFWFGLTDTWAGWEKRRNKDSLTHSPNGSARRARHKRAPRFVNGFRELHSPPLMNCCSICGYPLKNSQPIIWFCGSLSGLHVTTPVHKSLHPADLGGPTSEQDAYSSRRPRVGSCVAVHLMRSKMADRSSASILSALASEAENPAHRRHCLAQYVPAYFALRFS